MLAKQIGSALRELNRASAVRRLSARDPEHRTIEVYIIPTKAKQLALPEPRRKR
jgi:hypothetical protein